MTTPALETVPEKGLLARAMGVIFSPRETYAAIVAHPKVLGAMVAVIVLIAGINFAFLSTEVGQRATLDQQITMMESFGVQLNDQALDRMEAGLGNARYFAAVSIAVFVPLVVVLISAVMLVVFNAVLGGEATFKQVVAIQAHSGFIGVLQMLFVTPLNYMRETMASATSLAVFLPGVDSSSFLGMLLGGIDLFRIWGLVSAAIGLAVLYKRRTSPIAWSLITVYFVIILLFAGVRALFAGA